MGAIKRSRRFAVGSKQFVGGVSAMPDKSKTIFGSHAFMDLTLYQYGHERCAPLHTYGPATFNHFIFHYIHRGRGQLRSTDDKGVTNVYHLGAGQGFLIWPRQAVTYIADGEEPWRYTWAEFDGLRAKELLTQAGLTFNYPIYIAQNEEERRVVESEIRWISEHPGASSLKLIGHLYLFLDALISSSSVKRQVVGGSIRDFYIRESLNYIGQHYAEDLTVEDIAAYCNINRNHLGKLFRGALDKSPQEFLISYRMNKACELLKITDKPIGEISGLVGYPNQLNFSRSFKKVHGVSPRAWREANRIR